MSKSYDNYIGITEAPQEQFGKTMSIPDELLEEWFRLAVPLKAGEPQALLRQIATDPYTAKRDLARRIVTQFHGAESAAAAEADFDRLFREHRLPEEIPEVAIPLDDPAIRYEPGTGAWLPGLLARAGLAASNSEAIRLIEQGAITVDGEKVHDRNARVPLEAESGPVLRRGKRQFCRVVGR
jgi:tyrosyl-tRNA synthetase